MKQHTPGQWIAHEYGEAVFAKEGGKRICITAPQGRSASYEDQANAIFIAAAPETAAERDRLKAINTELLEALRDTLAICISRGTKLGLDDQGPVLDKARSAINNATKHLTHGGKPVI